MTRRASTLYSAALFLFVAATATGCGGSTSSTVTVTTTAAKPGHPALSFTALVARVRSGVVRIETTTCAGGEIGTGILLSPTLVATVEHVVDGATSIALKQNGSTVGYGTVIGEDPARDVALVRSNEPISGYHFRFAPRAPALGENVAAIGFPLGLPLTVTRGSVSGSDRTIPINGVNRTQLVQTDAPVNPGNSGGPLMTDSGLVVGLVDLGTNQANELAFAVSAAVAGPLIEGWRVAPELSNSPNCSGTYPQAASPATTTQTSSAAPPSYDGHDFEVSYPAGWTISHLSEGGGNLDTTFTDPSNPTILIRVDENPHAGALTPQAAAAPVIRTVSAESSYVGLGTLSSSFDGVPALRWEFEDVEGGVALHKVDEFFIDPSGHGWGVLIQAPQSVWGQDASPLQSFLDTLQTA